jgi:hypothetical protein
MISVGQMEKEKKQGMEMQHVYIYRAGFMIAEMAKVENERKNAACEVMLSVGQMEKGKSIDTKERNKKRRNVDAEMQHGDISCAGFMAAEMANLVNVGQSSRKQEIEIEAAANKPAGCGKEKWKGWSNSMGFVLQK